jgi:signal peptidase II
MMLAAIIAVVLVIDQVSKRLVVDQLPLGVPTQPIPALAPFFQFTYTHNSGAAFGFLPQTGDLFLLIAIVVVAAMLYFYPRIPANGHLTRIAIGMICGGALGNALDRLQYGVVIDFIHYQIPGVISNVSNPADHAIVLGVIIIFLESWLLDRHKEPEAAIMSDTGETPEPGQTETVDIERQKGETQ